MIDHVPDAELDVLLADWGEHARSTVGHQPMPELAVRPARTRRLGWQLAAGALAVAVAAGLVVGLPRLHAVRSAGDPLRGSVRTAVPGPNQQMVTFHGLTIGLPASWPTVVGEPCRLTGSVIQLPTAFQPACLPTVDPRWTVVRFGTTRQPIPAAAVRWSDRFTVSGLDATWLDGTMDGRSAWAVVVPALDASLLVEGGTEPLVDPSMPLEVDAVDQHGCPSRIARPDTFPTQVTAGVRLPSGPVSMSACRYVGGWLEQGATVTGTALRAFVGTVNGLPAGLSRPAPGSVDCAGLPATESAGDSYRFTLDYAQLTSIRLTARLARCGELGITTGSGTGRFSQQLGRTISALVGNAEGWPGSVVPAG